MRGSDIPVAVLEAIPSSVSNAIYRKMARLAAVRMGRCEVVRSVYARRSVAVGETRLILSDIDMSAVVRRPSTPSCDGDQLLSLLQRYRSLRKLLWRLGECIVYDPADLRRWALADPYRGSTDRRSHLLLFGDPPVFPAPAVRPDHAARRMAFWLEEYMPVALRTGNRRNLWKFLLEIWNCLVTGAGEIAEPYLTRGEARESLTHRAPELLEFEGRLAPAIMGACLDLMGRLHDRLLPALGRLAAPVVFSAPVPMSSGVRRFVVVPSHSPIFPPECFQTDAFVCTPEALHLYLHFVNPFLFWTLPDRFAEIGFQPPDRRQFLRACHFHGASFRLRFPGFHAGVSPASLANRLSVVEHAVHRLRGEEIPSPPEAPAQIPSAPRISLEEYYRQAYPALYRRSQAALRMLDEMAPPEA
jgi:hypothetical protein